ncbi:EAL domain-containing protein [Shewanella litorisediminis]|uniref:EAL domain-containing protein n=1 Tax=Shewanella litorisediminis TaxID=1173586 RepID=A0ABX7G2I6_9GAMM|nr:EAL domain-containing protein [Shewanella litorisediminis]MCL2917033.1 EAL domain-containing protein [Shewanella litorisediminis]QRH01514.1 EAL domain-containing protein [Shewanella litorisediminis]
MFRALFCALLSLILLFGALPASAEHGSYHYHNTLEFQHFSSSDGLNQNTITRLYTDKAGMLWAGSQDGLHYFNGQEFGVFLPDPSNADSLSEGFITDIVQDPEGFLWVSTYTQGVNRLDLQTGKFTRYGEADGLSELRVRRLAVIGDSLWIGTEKGLFAMQRRSGQIRPIPLGNALTPQITSLGNIEDEYLLVGTQAHGTYAISSNNIVKLKLPATSPVNQIHSRGNTAYLAIGKELWQYEMDTHTAKTLWQSEPQGFFHGDIRDFTLASSEEIWAIAPGAGLIELKKNDRWRARYHRNNSRSFRDISDNNLMSVLLDPNGVLWLGGSFSGLDKINIRRQYFEHLFDNSISLPQQVNMVRAIHQTRDGVIWIGTEGAGLKTLKPNEDSYQYHTDLFANALNVAPEAISLVVRDIIEDKEGSLWFASNYGLGHLHPSGAFRLLQPPQHKGLGRTLAIDKNGTLWMGSDEGLFYLPIQGTELQRFTLGEKLANTLTESQILVLEFIDDWLWIGTLDGLIRLNPNTNEVQVFTHDPSNSNSLGNNRIRDIYGAANGDIWVGTHGGISILRLEEDGWHIRHLSSNEGVPSDTIYAILEDRQGQFWFSSNAGISRYTPGEDSIITFNKFEGLQEQEYNGGVKFVGQDGYFWFGGINGITRFVPELIPKKRQEPPLALTSYSLGGKRTRILDLSAPPSVEMSFEDKVVSFEVTSLDFSYPGVDRFAYYLQGFDSQWRSAQAQTHITYTNLSPGNYLLRVRHGLAQNPLGYQILTVPLTVVAPWYRTPPAYLLYTLTLAAILGWLWRERHLKRRQRRDFETSIRASEERLKLALWASGDGMWDWDIPSGQVFRTRMHPHTQQQLNGPVLLDRIHPEDKPRVLKAIEQHIDGSRAFYEAEYRIEDRPGHWIWIMDRGKVVERDKHGKPVRMVGTHKDITSRKNTENELRLSAQVLASMNEAVVVGGLDYRIASVNPAFSLITGFNPEQVQGKHFLFLTHDRKQQQIYQAIEQQLLRNKHWAGELKIRTRDQRSILIWLEINQVLDSKSEASHFVAVFTDITDRKKAEEDLRLLASYDPLTNLPNRTLFQDRLDHALAQAHRTGNMVALLFLDLDRFKHINDSMGHHIGDLLLKAVANRLQNCVREGDTVARLGGDEFTIILEGVAKTKAATVIAEKLIRAFQTPFILEDQALNISPSIGISLYPMDASDSTSLVKYADTAMYHAKSLGRNNFQFYTLRLNEYAMRHVQLEAGIKQAIVRQELSLMFQPKFRVSDGSITGFEALLRWNSKELGPISPAEFIPLAEEIGIINQLGHWVVNEACRHMAHFAAAGFDNLHVAVNLSARQLKADILSTIEVALAVAGLPAKCLELELTESMIMKSPQESVAVLQRLKALGVSLAVDDFGTGYSSLAYLKRFPLDTLKIDREFVRDISTDPDDAAITGAIIALAHSLELNVVAEGVENEAQLEHLRKHGCDQVQGFLLGKPMSARDAMALLKSSSLET